MCENLTLRELRKSEISNLKGFTPDDWNIEFDKFCATHFSKEYYMPLVLTRKETIIATAQAFFNTNVGWAMFIIVRPEDKKKGLGRKITEKLIEEMFKRCSSILLIATKEGEVLYKKLGFEVNETYSFFEHKQINTNDYSNISPFEKQNEAEILKLDFKATNENRSFLLKPHLKNAFVYKSENGKIEGFYIENLTDGPIVALTETAGKNLLTFKHSRGKYRSVLPNSNIAGVRHLKSLGLNIKSEASRMHLGNGFNWKPQHIYCRIAGYCG